QFVCEACLPKCDHHRLRSREVLEEFAHREQSGLRTGVLQQLRLVDAEYTLVRRVQHVFLAAEVRVKGRATDARALENLAHSDVLEAAVAFLNQLDQGVCERSRRSPRTRV